MRPALALCFCFACTTEFVDVTPFSDLATAGPDIVWFVDHGAGEDLGRGDHTMTVQLRFFGMACERYGDDVEVRFNGLEPTFHTPGPDTRVVGPDGWTCLRGDVPTSGPLASSPVLPRDFDATVVIELSDATQTRTVVVRPPALQPFPTLQRIEAIAPDALLPHANGFTDADGIPVLYPGVTYQAVMDRPWVAVEARSEASEFLRRHFPPEEELPDVVLPGAVFDGASVALGPRDFTLETLHLYDWMCDDTESDCLMLDGFDQGIVSSTQLVQDFTDQAQVPLRWANLGERDHLCRTDGSCDDGLACGTDRVCAIP